MSEQKNFISFSYYFLDFGIFKLHTEMTAILQVKPYSLMLGVTKKSFFFILYNGSYINVTSTVTFDFSRNPC